MVFFLQLEWEKKLAYFVLPSVLVSYSPSVSKIKLTKDFKRRSGNAVFVLQGR